MEKNSSQINASGQADLWKSQGKFFEAFKGLSIEEKINKIVLQISKQTNNTKDSFPLFQIFNELHPLLEDLETFQNAISDDQTRTLYLKYHSFIKQSNKNTLTLSKASINPTPEKMVEIKDKILEMMKTIKGLHNQAVMSTQKHILWMDPNQANNSLELEQLQKDYKDKVIVKYYTDNKKFREDVMELKGFPTVIILSAAAAGSNTQYGDGDHFRFLKENKKSLRLSGVLIYCGYMGYDNLQGLLKDESRILRCITTEYDEMMRVVKDLVVPLDFKRYVPIADLDSYLSVSAKNNLLSWSQNDWSTRSLVELHPNKVNYKDIFKRGKDLIVSKGIRMRPELLSKMENIPDEIGKLFQSTQSNNEELSKSLMYMYSKESSDIPVYNVLNSTLNLMNEELINIMQPFIDLFLIALYYYDDSSDSKIKRPISNSSPKVFTVYEFYRGTTIPDDQFGNETIKVNNFISLPGFSSFSSDKEIAKVFIETNKGFVDSQPVIFNYQYKTGNTFFNNRPKFIDKVSPFPENEYLVYPFTLFRITEVIPPADGKEYYEIVLTVN